MFCGINCPICYSRRVQNLGLEYRCKACHNRWDTESGAMKKLAEVMDTPKSQEFNLMAHLHRQREFSLHTFGPEYAGVLDHLRKELSEIETAPNDLTEWVDVILLAFDGAWRSGHTPEEIVQAIADKQACNEARHWPDWRTVESGKAIEHVREEGL